MVNNLTAAQEIGPIQHGMSPTIRPKQQESAALAADIEAFLLAGGKIRRPDAGLPVNNWPRANAAQLTSIAAFCRQHAIKETEIFSAARDGRLTLWRHAGELHLMTSIAMQWMHERGRARNSKSPGRKEA